MEYEVEILCTFSDVVVVQANSIEQAKAEAIGLVGERVSVYDMELKEFLDFDALQVVEVTSND